MASAELVAQRFRAHFGHAPDVVASAPGRVNLIGEHTDYNEGLVLPMAIDRRTYVAASRRGDNRIAVRSEEFGEDIELREDELVPTRSARWHDYVAGVASELMRPDIMSDPPLTGEARGPRRPSALSANLLIQGDVPVGAGLASSAALEMSVARALCAIGHRHWNPLAMARLAQRAETHFVGVACGIMDQMAAGAGRSGHALLLDCRSLEVQFVGLPGEVSVVVMDTGVRRRLSTSEYNDRRASCDRATRAIRAIEPRVQALRDVTVELLDAAGPELDDVDRRRARHVVLEMGRPHAMAEALETGNFPLAGELMNDSHASLRDLYEVSGMQLDTLCDIARAHSACFGARLTGAGFGGCAIALVRAGAEGAFIRDTQPRYEALTYKRAACFVVRADEGARVERI